MRRRSRPPSQCLTLVTNAIVCWNTVYVDAALAHLANNGDPIADEVVRRIASNRHEHINFLGRQDLNPSTSPAAGELRPLQI
ncbi:MAG: Tn3 family transposase [Acidimicrobiales bacterium]